MATHDYVIANGTGASVRSDLNNALAAIVSQNSSGSEPSTKYAYQIWADTTTNKIKLRNSANNAWLEVGTTAGGVLSVTDALIHAITVGRGAGDVATNTVVGNNALDANTSGANNTAIGDEALTANTTASGNTAVGALSLDANSTGQNNTGIGIHALGGNTTASGNTAVGSLALLANTTGANNVAVGVEALDANTTANNNTAVGYQSLSANTTGFSNSAVGKSALLCNTTGIIQQQLE